MTQYLKSGTYYNLNIQKKIILINKDFVWNPIFRLIYLRKANLICHKDVKKNINILFINVITKIKQSKSNTKSAQKVKSITNLFKSKLQN